MNKIVGKCKKSGRYIVFQVEKTGFEKADIKGFYKISLKNTYSDTFALDLTASTSCPVCGNNKLGGCSHSCSSCGGFPGKGCQTCSELQLDFTQDYSGNSALYGQFAGQNDILGAKDKHGNFQGSEGDLGRDGAFRGKRIVILFLCRETHNAQKTKANVVPALAIKGFDVDFYDYSATELCDPSTLERILDGACQLWIIADWKRKMSDAHYDVVERFYHRGRGLYLLGDNDPFFVDVNNIATRLFGASLYGDYLGQRIIGISTQSKNPGIAKGHLISTGIVNFYEGSTIASIKLGGSLVPLTYNSEGNILTAYSNADYKRCLFDGGFTRLFCDWDSAGTDRYVKNAAVWLANVERFMDEYR